MRVRWLNGALANLEAIGEYIAKDDPAAAQRTVLRILESVDAMVTSSNVHMGRAGRVPGTRELVVTPNYLVPYRIRGGVLEVLRVLHARQRWPNRLP
jgi:addiction module RelE/StbE family toxin